MLGNNASTHDLPITLSLKEFTIDPAEMRLIFWHRINENFDMVLEIEVILIEETNIFSLAGGNSGITSRALSTILLVNNIDPQLVCDRV
ncbi:hypothetical protein ASF34_21180 [Methylobacterium sp. Leaf106]|nr:hypothetical protein ASF34_21180 [Methylobacterium sp. Leaf106]